MAAAADELAMEPMQDFLFVSFFLGHRAGKRARTLLADCGLLETAINSRMNRDSWLGRLHFGVCLRLPIEDPRLAELRRRLRRTRADVYERYDRVYSEADLDAAAWLLLRVATAGLFGGVDYGQSYAREAACPVCGAGAVLDPPLIAELGKLGRKDIDHLVYEGHLIVTRRLGAALRAARLTGFDLVPVRSPKRPVSSRFSWLRVTNTLPRFSSSSSGLITERQCPSCGRAGHYGTARRPEELRYDLRARDWLDFNRTWEYFGDWQQVRAKTHLLPIGGAQELIVSQRARQVLLGLRVPRLKWVPVAVGEGKAGPEKDVAVPHIRSSQPATHKVIAKRTRTGRRGFVSHELTISMAILALAVGIGLLLSMLLRLEGAAVFVPPAFLVGGLVAWVIGGNVADAVRQRKHDRGTGSAAQPLAGPTDPAPGVSQPPTDEDPRARDGETPGTRCAEGNDRSRPDTTMRRLLIIEAAFPIAGRGIVVSPALPWGCGTAFRDIRAELRRPDGSVSRVELLVVIEHANRRFESPEEAQLLRRPVCLLQGVSIDEVRPGSEIWCRDELTSGHGAG